MPMNKPKLDKFGKPMKAPVLKPGKVKIQPMPTAKPVRINKNTKKKGM